MDSPVTTRIVGKFQVTVPPEIREIFGLREGDLLDWKFDEASGEIHITAKRAQVMTPLVRQLLKSFEKQSQEATAVAEGAQG